MESVKVFISYHQKDQELREELEKHLASLQREKTITSWSDRQIVAGQESKGEIDKYLNQAGLILLLVSPDFIDSDYHWTVEVTRALERNAAGKASVIPVLLRSVDWETPPIDKLSPLPRNREPIKSKSWTYRDDAFKEVVKGIREEVKRLVANSNYSPPKQDEDIKRLVANSNYSPPKQDEDTKEFDEKLDRLLRELDSKPDYNIPLSSSKKSNLEQERQYQEMLKLRDENLTLIEEQVAAQELEKRQYQVTSLINEADRLRSEDKKSEEAVLKYKAALILDPNSVYAHHCLGFVLDNQGKLEEAIACYQKALQIDPNFAYAHNNLGSALKNQGKVDEAIACYQKALQIDPNFAYAHNNLGSALYNQGKLDEAIACYQKALQIDPNYAYAHYNLGSALYNQGKLDEAIACYQKALQIDPNFAYAHNNLGSALYNQGKLDEAIASYQKALQIDPNFAYAHNNLGSALYNQGKLDEAIASYQKALQIDPNFVNAHYNLGSALKNQGKVEEAIACYQKALQIDPNFVNAHYNLGLALYNQGKLDEAIAELEIAVHLEPTNSLFRQNLETIRNKKKNEDDAKDAVAHNNLGVALDNQGKLDEAIAELEIAVHLDPTNTQFRKNLEIIRNKKKGFLGRFFGG